MQKLKIGIIIVGSIALAAFVWSLIFAVLTFVRFKQGYLAHQFFVVGDFAAPIYYAFYYFDRPSVQTSALTATAGAGVLIGGLIAARWPIQDPWQARWASRRDLTKRQFVSLRNGLVLGRLSPGVRLPLWRRKGGRIGGAILYASDSRHLAVLGATRSGKGVGVVVPAILTARGSVVVMDQKGENYLLTAGYRETKGPVFVFNPYSEKTHRYNPLDFIRRDPGDYETDIRALAEFIIPTPRNGAETFWAKAAQGLLTGLVSYVIESSSFAGRRTLFSALLVLRSGNVTKNIKAVVENDTTIGSFTRRQLLTFLNIDSDKVRSNVMQQLNGELEFFDNPHLRYATGASDFNIRQLSHTTMSVFICMSKEEMSLASSLVRILVQQSTTYIQRRNLKIETIGHVRYILDEFGRLGRLETLVDDFPYLAGYNTQFVIATQDISQLYSLYGADRTQTLLANASYQLILGVNDNATGEYYSNRLGTRTAPTRSRSSSFRGVALHGQTSISRSATAAPLASNADLQRLDARRGVLIMEGVPPVLTYRLRYYEEPKFRGRVGLPVTAAPCRPTLADIADSDDLKWKPPEPVKGAAAGTAEAPTDQSTAAAVPAEYPSEAVPARVPAPATAQGPGDDNGEALAAESKAMPSVQDFRPTDLVLADLNKHFADVGTAIERDGMKEAIIAVVQGMPDQRKLDTFAQLKIMKEKRDAIRNLAETAEPILPNRPAQPPQP